MGACEATFRPAVEQIGRRHSRRPIPCPLENPALRAGRLFWVAHLASDSSDVCVVRHYRHRIGPASDRRADERVIIQSRIIALVNQLFRSGCAKGHALDWFSVLIPIRRDIRILIYGIIWPMQNHQSWCRQYPFWRYFAPVTSPWLSPAEDAEPMGVAVSPKSSRPAFFPGAFGASSRPLRSQKSFALRSSAARRPSGFWATATPMMVRYRRGWSSAIASQE